MSFPTTSFKLLCLLAAVCLLTACTPAPAEQTTGVGATTQQTEATNETAASTAPTESIAPTQAPTEETGVQGPDDTLTPTVTNPTEPTPTEPVIVPTEPKPKPTTPVSDQGGIELPDDPL